MLPEAVARVVTRFPKVRVITDESAYEALVAGVRAGDIDFILGALRASDLASDLENERLMSENLVVLARHDHPLAKVRNLGLATIAAAQWILPRSHSPARGLFESLFRRMKLKPPMPTVESADLAVIRGPLLHTDMLAVMSAQQLSYECEAGLLAVLDVPMRETTRDIGLMTRVGSPPSSAARALIDAIRVGVPQSPSGISQTKPADTCRDLPLVLPP
jgi:LysR family transcriptional regulator of gallate degradation